MSRLVIAIDCDDVIINATEYLVDTYNTLYGTKVNLKNAHTSRNLEWGAERDEVFRRLHAIQLSDEYAEISPREDAIMAITQLAKKHELHMVSARHEVILPVTERMLETYLPNCFKRIEHVSDLRSKGEVCREIKADVMIDDNMKHLVSAKEVGVSTLIWFGSYPWQNEEELITGVDRCLDWPEVLALIEEL